MYRTKTFSFKISNFNGTLDGVKTPEDIDNAINGFMSQLPKGTEVLGIENKPIVIARGKEYDTVILYYTIFYDLTYIITEEKNVIQEKA